MNAPYMTSEQLVPYAEALAIELVGLAPIQRNKYCAIGKGRLSDGRACILKDYGESDPALAAAEAEALRLYDKISAGAAHLKGCGLLAYNADKNLLAISFMEGQSFTRFIYASLLSGRKRKAALRHARMLGGVLRELYLKGPASEEGQLGAFMREYLEHTTVRLENVPVLGRVILKGDAATVEELLSAVAASGEKPSFCHGDFVPRNAHTDDQGIGLIDWANTSGSSHILNDVYNLRTALHNMLLPRTYKVELMQALSLGLGDLAFDVSLHRFFYEYHRRRWLMLKIYACRPWPWLQVLRALATFAKPFSGERLGPLREQVKGLL